MRTLHELLLERGQTLSVAESCTGGLLGAALTERAGSSAYFLGGALTYSNELKHALLEIPQSVLETHGAVSPECARAMAFGVRKLTGSDWALSVTGIAGPGGATETRPVGLVYVGLAGPDRLEAREFRFEGDRAEVRRRSVESALAWLEEALA